METQNRIFISLNTKNAIAPYYSYPLAMGYDLFASEALTILAGRKAFVDTAVSIKIPEGMYGLTSTRVTANGMELHPMISYCYASQSNTPLQWSFWLSFPKIQNHIIWG